MGWLSRGRERREAGGHQPTRAYAFAEYVVPPLLATLANHEWAGTEHLQAITPGRGFVVAANHISLFDPPYLAYFLWDNGFPPYFLAKESLFRTPGFGAILRGSRQIPVYRGSHTAIEAYRSAVAAVREGRCVVLYPEGTTTRDPDGWPMAGKTGAARIALETGCPVIPVGNWGVHQVLPLDKRLPAVLPRQTARFQAGPAVDLSDLFERPIDRELLRQATDRIMAAITDEVASLRGEPAPHTRFQD